MLSLFFLLPLFPLWVELLLCCRPCVDYYWSTDTEVRKVRSNASVCCWIWRYFLITRVSGIFWHGLQSSVDMPPRFKLRLWYKLGQFCHIPFTEHNVAIAANQELLHPRPYRPIEKPTFHHINNQAQKNGLTKKKKIQSIQNVSVKCFKEQGLYESMGRAEARPQYAALPCLCSH